MPVIDCTFRDGGYYTDWNFPDEVVQEYLRVMKKAKVEFVELGFRSDKAKGGNFSRLTDNLITIVKKLKNPRPVQIAVMVNAKEALTSVYGADGYILSLFCESRKSPVSLVRVAAQFSEALSCEKLCRTLNALGYPVALNLMQCADKNLTAIDTAAKIIHSWGLVDVLYLADSLGSLDPLGAFHIVDTLSMTWGHHLGVHMHDNRGMALANTLAAHQAGAKWLDSTVGGMGRGAGNTKTEHLLTDLGGEYEAEPVFDLAREVFNGYQAAHGWGPSQLYFLSAKYAVHPTYVQEMIGRSGVDHNDILIVLKKLRDAKACLYDAKMLDVFLKEVA